MSAARLRELREMIAAELARPAEPAARAMAERLAKRPGVAAVLFYGARMREGAGVAATAGEGPLDLYVLTDGNVAYHGFGLAALANRLLPPNIYREVSEGPPRTEAKVAVLTLAAFRRRMRPGSLDTTLWARFAQPAVLVWARSEADRTQVIDAVVAAVETAAGWAARLTADAEDPEDSWRALFRHTYASELRVEDGRRARDLVAAAPGRYARLHRMLIAPRGPADGATARPWRWRRRAGKALNLARLVKAAFTYRDGLAYALAKVERHSGRPVELAPWQQRWKWLAAPFVVWRLWRERRLK